jgi:hypothetical protein
MPVAALLAACAEAAATDAWLTPGGHEQHFHKWVCRPSCTTGSLAQLQAIGLSPCTVAGGWWVGADPTLDVAAHLAGNEIRAQDQAHHKRASSPPAQQRCRC